MSLPLDNGRARACLRLEALLRDEAQPLAPATRRLLRELAAARHTVGPDRRTPAEDAALALSELVDHGQLSDETADRLWLALAGCAHARRSAAAAHTT